MSRRPAGALAGIAMILLFAVTAAAVVARTAPPRSAFDVPRPAVPMRDVVRTAPSALSAHIATTAATWGRYSIGDGTDATIAVSVTSACRESCDAADPQAIASFIGTLVHSSEVNLLTVQLDTPRQIEYDCGYGAAACYFTSQNRIILSGDETYASDGANREFVLAHEYGHHVAQHRRAPAPFAPAIDWGTPRWSTYKNVCQGQRSRRLFPGNEGFHYFQDPGEAFAESFAYNRFPDAPQRWAWVDSLRPNATAFAAIRHDVLEPWAGRQSLTFSGRLNAGGRRMIGKTFRLPLDGRLRLRLQAPPGVFELILRNRLGRKLRDSTHVGRGHLLGFTACGQSSLRAIVERRGERGGRFTLSVYRP
ncbi:MAG TPA: hypothetical protein VF176_10650 [Solirubrobacterales bacterium]